MKKVNLMIAGLLMSSMILTGCGEKNSNNSNGESNSAMQEPTSSVELAQPQSSEGTSIIEATEDGSIPEGYVRSQFTNELIPIERDQIRPVAVMTPDDATACPHYSISKADLIYECRVEGTISRFMVLYQNWEDGMDRIGNIRSCREYYAYWAAEWDSVILHFGQAIYAKEILESDHVDHIDGNKAVTGVYYRSTDRSSPQNAYTSSEGIEFGFHYYNLSKTHTDRYREGHFTFAPNGGQSDLSAVSGVFDCTNLNLSALYPIDKPYYVYNEENQKYYRFQYGKEHVDAVTCEQLAFSNIVIQDCVWAVKDEKGYLWFNTVDSGKGYFLTNGKCVPITWKKSEIEGPTKYYDLDGNEILFSTGKTIICINEAGNASPAFE